MSKSRWWVDRSCDVCPALGKKCYCDWRLYFGAFFVAHIGQSGKSAKSLPQLVRELNKAGITLPMFRRFFPSPSPAKESR